VTTQGKAIKTANTNIHVDDEGIIHIIMNDNSHIEYEETVQQFEFCAANCEIGKCIILVDSGKFSTISKEAREFSNRKESVDLSYAQAVVVHNVAQRIIINFLKTFYNNNGPLEKMKVFTDRQKAYQWLMEKKRELDNSI
jgi:hypothetical protein